MVCREVGEHSSYERCGGLRGGHRHESGGERQRCVIFREPANCFDQVWLTCEQQETAVWRVELLVCASTSGSICLVLTVHLARVSLINTKACLLHYIEKYRTLFVMKLGTSQHA